MAKKNQIRLTEAQLHMVIKESVNKILNEGGHLCWTDVDGQHRTNSQDLWHGVVGATFVWHGTNADSEVWVDGKEINGSDLEEFCWNEYKYECEDKGEQPTEQGYDNLPVNWFADKLEDYLYAISEQA